MKLIERIDIENWAKLHEAKGFFPYLISKLVYFTTLPEAFINIPSGSAVYIGGWDGEVNSAEERSYIPAGRSLWEFGTDKTFKSKAEKDYKKRTEDPIGYIPSECTFIFVTPMLWSKKETWRKAKMAEGIWHNILVYDSIDLEQWLDHSSPVATWFAKELKKAPAEGLIDPDLFWKEWSKGPEGSLTTKTITSGREKEMELLSNFINSDCDILAVQAKTKSEALAFIIATVIEQLDETHKDRFFSKAVIVDKEESYRTLYTNYLKTPLILIAKFEDKSVMHAAVSAGHHVIVPLGGDDEINLSNVIVLPTIRKDGQMEGLIEMGLSKQDAEKYSREAGRDINKLKRLLNFSDNKSAWFKTENIRDIIPALLIGRWNSYNSGDKEILEKLSGMTYEKYLEILLRWKNLEDSPIIQIGDTWRLTSPLDLWNSLSKFLTQNDLTLLAESFLSVYQDDENINDINIDIIQITYSFSKPKKYSDWAKEGLVQTLILVSLYGGNLQLAKTQNTALWVDSIIFMLLDGISGKKWISLRKKLPLIAEASPKSFIKVVRNSLQSSNPEIMEMFNAKETFLGESSAHTWLLWALEALAWLPDYLFESSLLLLKLASLDPGGNMRNRPSNSLVEIYKIWHFQTLAPFEQRMEILKAAVKKEKEEGWKLLLNLLPKGHDNASSSHKVRWRLFDEKISLHYTYEEIYKTQSVIVELLIELFDNTDEKLAQIIKHSTRLANQTDKEKILSLIENAALSINKNSTSSRDEIRKILNHHRSYPDAKGALDPKILDRYQSIYDALEPEDIILKYKWLFVAFHINFPDGKFKEEDDENQYKSHFNRVKETRKEALQIILETVGLSKTIKLADTYESSRNIGEVLSKVVSTEQEILTILHLLKEEKPNLTLIYPFINSKVIENGIGWIFDMFQKLHKENFTDAQLANLFIPLDPNQIIWDFIQNKTENLEKSYWISIDPHFYHNSIEEKIIGLGFLLKYKRFVSAINSAYMIRKDLPTSLILEILQRTATEKDSEDLQLKAHEVGKLFKEIEHRDDFNLETFVKLEWLYLPIISSYGSGYKPKHLHNELVKSPDFFVEILKLAYRLLKQNQETLNQGDAAEENIEKLTQNAYELLDNFKEIPGIQVDNSIDAIELNNWIDSVRKLAEEDYLEIADMEIGKILAQFPGNYKEFWPADEISEVIERINTKSLKESFSVNVINKRAFTGRSLFDGGKIEKTNAADFQNLAIQHRYKHPNLSEIFSNIAQNYLHEATHQDNQAERDKLEY